MAQEIINYGAAANDGTGDPLRTAFIKTDDNFDQIWAAGPVGSNITILNNTVGVTNTNGNLVLNPNGVGVIQTNSRVIPRLNNTYDLGSSDQRYRSAYIGTGGLSVTGNLSANNVVISGGLDLTGDVVIDGNLTVNGNATYINVANLIVEDKNIVLANGSPNAVAANGGGITLDGANATITYSNPGNRWDFNLGIAVNGLTTTSSMSVQTDATAWFIGGNVLTTPNGGTWYADTVGNDEYISSAFDGFISVASLYNTGNVASEIDFEHGQMRLNVNDVDGNAYTWGLGQLQIDGTVIPDLTTPGNIIPGTNNVFSLGNATNQWSDLYVSNATIYMNNVPVTLSAGNVLTVAGQPVLSNDSDTSITTTGNITADEFFGNISASNVVGLSTVATTGSYNDLSDTPVIPTATSNLINDSGFITANVTGNITAGNVYVGGNIVGNTDGFAIGYRDIPQVSFTDNATITTGDAGKHFYSMQSSNYTLTIANNASQGFQVGAAITVVNQGTGTITIAQGSGVTLYMAGNATAGNRTLSTFGMATIMKVDTDTWFINGTGVS